MISGKTPGYLVKGLGRYSFISAVGCMALMKNLSNKGGASIRSVIQREKEKGTRGGGTSQLIRGGYNGWKAVLTIGHLLDQSTDSLLTHSRLDKSSKSTAWIEFV